MIKHMFLAAGLLVACKSDKPAATSDNASGSAVAGSVAGSAARSNAGSGSGAGSARGSAEGSGTAGSAAGSNAGTATVAVPIPPPTTIAFSEPPTAESVHVEIAYALARWHATPRDKSLYAADFGGRDVADGREPLVPYDQWLAKLPPTPALIQNASVSTWLENKDRGEHETRVNVSYFYGCRQGPVPRAHVPA